MLKIQQVPIFLFLYLNFPNADVSHFFLPIINASLTRNHRSFVKVTAGKNQQANSDKFKKRLYTFTN